MKQGLKIIKEIVDELGEDLNDLVDGLGVKTYVELFEGEYIVDPKFKKLVSIIAYNNYMNEPDAYTTEGLILLTKDFNIYQKYLEIATSEGNAPLLLRAELLLFMLKSYCLNKEYTPIEVLKEYENKKFYKTKKNLKSIFEFYIGKRKEKDIVYINVMDVCIISLITGKTRYVINEQIRQKYLDDQEEVGNFNV